MKLPLFLIGLLLLTGCSPCQRYGYTDFTGPDRKGCFVCKRPNVGNPEWIELDTFCPAS